MKMHLLVQNLSWLALRYLLLGEDDAPGFSNPRCNRLAACPRDPVSVFFYPPITVMKKHLFFVQLSALPSAWRRLWVLGGNTLLVSNRRHPVTPR